MTITMIVYTAIVKTDSSDTYVWVYAYEPTREEIIQRLYDMEGAESLEWYDDTTGIHINQTNLTEKKA